MSPGYWRERAGITGWIHLYTGYCLQSHCLFIQSAGLDSTRPSILCTPVCVTVISFTRIRWKITNQSSLPSKNGSIECIDDVHSIARLMFCYFQLLIPFHTRADRCPPVAAYRERPCVGHHSNRSRHTRVGKGSNSRLHKSN